MARRSRFIDHLGEVVVSRDGGEPCVDGRPFLPGLRDVLTWLDDPAIRPLLLNLSPPPTRSIARPELRRLAARLVRDFQRGLLRARRTPARCVAAGELPHTIPVTYAADPWSRDSIAAETRELERISDPRWSSARVPVGTTLQAIVTYDGIVVSVPAEIVIFEIDGAARQPIARVRTTIPTGSGDHEVCWRRTPEDAAADLQADAAAGDRRPLEYRFVVESRQPRCHGESGPLWLTNTVDVTLVSGNDRIQRARPRGVVLTDAIGEEHRTRTRDGVARFEAVLVGPFDLRIAAVRFTSLTWNAHEAPVGEPVDAVFEYEDAIDGAEAVVLFEAIRHDGAVREVGRRKATLAEGAGEGRVSFAMTADQTRELVAAGRLEIRYRVVAEGEKSRPSDSLWLVRADHPALDDTDIPARPAKKEC